MWCWNLFLGGVLNPARYDKFNPRLKVISSQISLQQGYVTCKKIAIFVQYLDISAEGNTICTHSFSDLGLLIVDVDDQSQRWKWVIFRDP